MDTSRIKSLTTGKVDADSMSFGPPKAGGPSWGRGSQTKGPSRTEVKPKSVKNTFVDVETPQFVRTRPRCKIGLPDSTPPSSLLHLKVTMAEAAAEDLAEEELTQVQQ